MKSETRPKAGGSGSFNPATSPVRRRSPKHFAGVAPHTPHLPQIDSLVLLVN